MVIFSTLGAYLTVGGPVFWMLIFIKTTRIWCLAGQPVISEFTYGTSLNLATVL